MFLWEIWRCGRLISMINTLVSLIVQEDQRKWFLILSLIEFGRNSKVGRRHYYGELERRFYRKQSFKRSLPMLWEFINSLLWSSRKFKLLWRNFGGGVQMQKGRFTRKIWRRCALWNALEAWVSKISRSLTMPFLAVNLGTLHAPHSLFGRIMMAKYTFHLASLLMPWLAILAVTLGEAYGVQKPWWKRVWLGGCEMV